MENLERQIRRLRLKKGDVLVVDARKVDLSQLRELRIPVNFFVPIIAVHGPVGSVQAKHEHEVLRMIAHKCRCPHTGCKYCHPVPEGILSVHDAGVSV